ncbi:MAG: glycosylphosphatidylinositol anchor biosynthesis [Cyphobasidiales sp. Tagirdzhanova-0007]|nr:MAG: glycosylphosphatidylinositol anchor biosynthesis [Cyphobasidiales sp. Tagirdzhanova-0007]
MTTTPGRSSWTSLLLLLSLFGLLAPYAALASGLGDSTNNWAVLVCTSRYWFNYRHMANTLGMYRTVKRLGIPDSNIILMLADDVACNSRNSFAGKVYANAGRYLDLYGESIEVDYRGYEVSVENFIRLLTGRTTPDTPGSKRLDTNERSNIFVYMTGHGGDEFLKFQDNEEISAFDIADAFQQMHVQKRYKEVFFMIDTCQANTMYSKFYSPGLIATGSSGKGENSYSHHSDSDLGVAVIDRYTHVVLNYLEGINKTSPLTLQDLFDRYSYDEFHSNAGIRTDLFDRDPKDVRLTDFFGGVQEVELDRAENDLHTTEDKIDYIWAEGTREVKRDKKRKVVVSNNLKEPEEGPSRRIVKAVAVLLAAHGLMTAWVLCNRKVS